MIELGSTVHADEAPHWDRLHDRFLTKRIKWTYSAEGPCTYDAESHFSRVRRAEIGIHHHIAGPYLGAYAPEMAWREDNRRVSNGQQYMKLATRFERTGLTVGKWRKGEGARRRFGKLHVTNREADSN